MPWTRPTLTELEQRVEGDVTSRLTGNAPLMRKAVLKIISKALAVLAHILHGFLSYLATNVLPDQAEGEWLERIARARGLDPVRLPASAASGTITVTGSDGTEVPVGWPFVSDAGLEYVTTEVGTVDSGTTTVAATCRAAGEDGNIPVGAALAIQSPISGLDSTATVAAAFTGGADQETDQALRERLLALIQDPPAGGSAADYVKWARSVAGVRRAWCFPNYYGNGSVAVVLTAVGSDPVPSGGLVSQVQAYIDQDDVRPVTANVVVSPIVAAPVDLNLSITPDTAALRTAIEANLEAMFEADAAPGGILYLSHLHKAINVAGLLDYEIDVLEVNDVSQPIQNYQFTGFNYPVLGAVSFAEL